MMSDRHHGEPPEVLVQGPFPISDSGRQDPDPAPPSPAIKRERRLGLLLLVVIVTLATLIALGASSRSNDPGDDSLAARASTTATLQD